MASVASAAEVTVTLEGSASPNSFRAQRSTTIRSGLLAALAAHNAKEVVDSGVIAFKPDADGFDCYGWLWTTVFAWRGRSLRHIVLPWATVVLQAAIISAACDPRIMQEHVLRFPPSNTMEEGYQILAVPVAFLLVFRLNRAAVRFYDARAAFGKLVEIVRVLSAQVVEFCAHDHKARDDCCRWAVVFPVASRNFLRGKAPDESEELAGILTDGEMTVLQSAVNQPLLCLDRMRRAVMEGVRSNKQDSDAVISQQFRCMEDSITILTGTVGTCERINGTPLPFAYVAHLRQFLLLYLLGMPWALQTSYGWGSVLVVAIVAFAMLGIEAAAVTCERPFGGNANHLPMDTFCQVVAKNVEQILSQAVAAERSVGVAIAEERGDAFLDAAMRSV